MTEDKIININFKLFLIHLFWNLVINIFMLKLHKYINIDDIHVI